MRAGWRLYPACEAFKHACSRGLGSGGTKMLKKGGGFWQLPNTCVQNHHMLIPTAIMACLKAIMTSYLYGEETLNFLGGEDPSATPTPPPCMKPCYM